MPDQTPLCELCDCPVDTRFDYVDCPELGTRHSGTLRCAVVAAETVKELRRLLRECCETIRALSDQQAMPDDSWMPTYKAAMAAGGGE